jgi:phosphoribosyl 1,2-cyclic phosphate phosphodiesterase
MCNASRKFAGKDFRKRSSILINEDLIIDLGPDFMSSSFIHGVDTTNIRYWLQTHSHSDHFSAGHLITRITEYAAENIKPLSLFASPLCIQNMSEQLGREEYGANLFEIKWLNKLNLDINKVKHNEAFQCGSYSVVAFDANHDDKDGASIYLVSDNTCKLFYGLDTNGITEETYNYLEDKHICLDIVVLDHTYGYDVKANDHLTANKFIETINEMKNRSIISQNTKIFASHISHEGNLPHNEFVLFAEKYGYDVAFDGLIISR